MPKARPVPNMVHLQVLGGQFTYRFEIQVKATKSDVFQNFTLHSTKSGGKAPT